MADVTGGKADRVTMNCRLTVLSRMELLGAAEVSPQVIGCASGEFVPHDEPPIQAQVSVNNRLVQGPGHHGEEPPGLVRVSQEKYGFRILNKIPQTRYICPS